MGLRLTARSVESVKEPGRYGDGRGGFGLFLRVRRVAGGRISKTWCQRIRIGGQVTNLGLGPYPLVTLAEARDAALENARAVRKGRDPRRPRGPVWQVPTFSEAAAAVIDVRRPGWKNPERMTGQWRASLRDYFPRLQRRQVTRITTGDLLAALAPVWSKRPAASKLALQRAKLLFDWVQAQGHRSDNPATAVRAALPSGGRPTKHHRALHHGQVAAALERVRGSRLQPAARLCFQFLVLTGVRSNEAREARWSEIDREASTWTIPPERMKGKREHVVPLSAAALAVLDDAISEFGYGTWLFPSVATGEALGHHGLRSAAAHAGGSIHGMRTALRSWASERGVSRDVGEALLAHRPATLEATYRDSDLLERRRPVMEAWAEYVTGSEQG